MKKDELEALLTQRPWNDGIVIEWTPNILIRIDPRPSVTLDHCRAALDCVDRRNFGDVRETEYQYLKALLRERNRRAGVA